MAASEIQEEIDEIRNLCKEYQPGQTKKDSGNTRFPKDLYIGLFGRTGCGKSSLINSLKFAVNGRLRRGQWIQVAGQLKAGGHTLNRVKAEIAPHINVVDNRGMDNPSQCQAIMEVRSQLEGKRGYTDKVVWDDEPDEQNDEYLRDVGDKITCVIFVLNAGHGLLTNVEGLSGIIDFFHEIRGRYPVAVITHVDTVPRKTVDDLTIALKVAGVSDIFEVANITEEKRKLEPEYQLNLLNLLDRCMTDGDETMVFLRNKEYEQNKKDEAANRRRLREEEDEDDGKDDGGCIIL